MVHRGIKFSVTFKGDYLRNGQNRVYPMVMWPLSGALLIQRPKQPQVATSLANAGYYPTVATFSPGVPDFDYSTREGYPIVMPPTR